VSLSSPGGSCHIFRFWLPVITLLRSYVCLLHVPIFTAIRGIQELSIIACRSTAISREYTIRLRREFPDTCLDLQAARLRNQHSAFRWYAFITCNGHKILLGYTGWIENGEVGRTCSTHLLDRLELHKNFNLRERSRGRFKRRRVRNIRMDLAETGPEDMHWIYMD
jgi:hypothetical protein